ncbi:hypothetical protein ACRE_026240 [Hapsidospora chrysogenum ATCC 11550]|uniref:Uncharacterized protein n=1 Tax=Hapsidospora chrysogenum (strain ATCC 11550 / CBS 779.69 / DSM 880 / IAM 14645 / JCM 23072 / IMI 49137) TaxID=857340 RepID=A0A086TAW3_HAPC1|nr:hypothetical protein ACRE_026240 [Hapsidospora chrysogenum ATCC 11550]
MYIPLRANTLTIPENQAPVSNSKGHPVFTRYGWAKLPIKLSHFHAARTWTLHAGTYPDGCSVTIDSTVRDSDIIKAPTYPTSCCTAQ